MSCVQIEEKYWAHQHGSQEARAPIHDILGSSARIENAVQSTSSAPIVAAKAEEPLFAPGISLTKERLDKATLDPDQESEEVVESHPNSRK